MGTEKPVTFVNRNGYRLFGMLYLPEQDVSRRVGIIISVNAIKYRLGTFRLHVLLARKLCDIGYTVFSFDPEGIGDSEGEFEHKLLSEHYHDIQTGKYNHDLTDAIDYFTDACSIESLLLCGLCGGAISVLMEAGGDPRVDGLILLNPPVLVEDLERRGEASSAAAITSAESASSLLKDKLRRLAEIDFWRRLVRLQVNLGEEARLVCKATAVLALKIWEKSRSLVSSRATELDLNKPVSRNPLFNMRFQASFAQSMAAKKQILFVFAEFDPWTWIFKSEFQDLVLQPGNPYENYLTHELILAANHIFSGTDSQKQLEQRIIYWLSARYPVQQASYG
jgi:pimeloyl-ACP methyl ester carboxylesterase